ncbi:hypothetical protein LJC74_06540 [Eubacteriales bacterium OttesenSCG-928-A19]|nr:hypothetical protein [Eubacteriales bacterium OttesenSCG-928-A19]
MQKGSKMSKKPNRFGEAFRVKEEDVFSQLTPSPEKTIPVMTTREPEKKKEPKAKKAELKRVSFYITPEQHRAIKMLAAQGTSPEDKDISAIVRNALHVYLENKQKAK